MTRVVQRNIKIKITIIAMVVQLPSRTASLSQVRGVSVQLDVLPKNRHSIVIRMSIKVKMIEALI